MPGRGGEGLAGVVLQVLGVDDRGLSERRGPGRLDVRQDRATGEVGGGAGDVGQPLQPQDVVGVGLADVVPAAVRRVAVRVEVVGAVPVEQLVAAVRAVGGDVALEHVTVPAAVLPVGAVVVLAPLDPGVLRRRVGVARDHREPHRRVDARSAAGSR